MLWACLYFPDLAFAAAFAGVADDGAPRALVDGPVQRRRVLAADASARAAGVAPGQALAAAHVLCPQLTARPRAPNAETGLLEELAAWCYQFSGQVSLAPPQSLLLEIGASLHLFGGWPALERRLREGLAALGHAHRLAATPTAAAAWLLARHQDGVCIQMPAPLLTMLGNLPLARCGLPAAATMTGMGFRHLRELFRLPRPELQRRIGADGLDWLDRLRGHAPEALHAWRPPDHFEQTLEFDTEVRGGDALLFPLRRLTGALANMLAARDGGVQRFDLVMAHAAAASTRVGVELAAPQREAATLFALARTRLERVALPAPVRALTLQARQLPTFRPGLRDLFEPVRGDGLDWPALCERLRARLGDGALHQRVAVAGHRPECSWRDGDGNDAKTTRENRPRPLWLLPQPYPLRGELRVVAGPERIESGWWDGHDQRRDYYRVETGVGQHAWAFRAAGAADGWMLHGWFA
jgi:protein ImuB